MYTQGEYLVAITAAVCEQQPATAAALSEVRVVFGTGALGAPGAPIMVTSRCPRTRRPSPPTLPSAPSRAARPPPAAGWRGSGRRGQGDCRSVVSGGLRRSKAAALRWADVQDATDGSGVLVYVRRSKTDQDGTAADVRYLKNGCAVALRQLRDRITVQRAGLRPEPTDQVLGGLGGQSIARRLAAAARASGIDGRITGHSGRVGLASELTARGASTTETMLAGGWKTARMVAHSLRRRSSRAGRCRQVPVETLLTGFGNNQQIDSIPSRHPH